MQRSSRPDRGAAKQDHDHSIALRGWLKTTIHFQPVARRQKRGGGARSLVCFSRVAIERRIGTP